MKFSRFILEVDMEHILYFVLTFLGLYFLSYIFIIRKASQYHKKKVPIEVEYLMRRYQLDFKKIDYRNFINTVSMIGIFIISLTVVIVFPIENILLQLLCGFIVMVPLILISYHLVGTYYKKKGSKENEYKTNRK